MVLYLLIKGCDPFKADSKGQTIFHLNNFYGRYECMSIILNYLRHLERVKLVDEVKKLMLEYKFKKTDFTNGNLTCYDKHLLGVQNRFFEFTERVCENYQNYVDNILNQFKNSLNYSIDHHNRNPIHYGAFSKYNKFFKFFFLF